MKKYSTTTPNSKTIANIMKKVNQSSIVENPKITKYNVHSQRENKSFLCRNPYSFPFPTETFDLIFGSRKSLHHKKADSRAPLYRACGALRHGCRCARGWIHLKCCDDRFKKRLLHQLRKWNPTPLIPQSSALKITRVKRNFKINLENTKGSQLR